MHLGTRWISGVVCGAVLLGWGTVAYAEAFTGAAAAVMSDSGYPAKNIFQAPADAYLAGGPQSPNSSGLPDGYYFFQVTTADGSTLLSTDAAVNRQVVVVNGRVAGAVVTAHDGLPVPPAPHANGVTLGDGSTPVQLAPFAPPPGNSDRYEVWLIRQKAVDRFAVLQTASIDPQNPQALVFGSGNAKTTTFRIQAGANVVASTDTTRVGGIVFYDTNSNGKFEYGPDTLMPGVRIRVTVDGVLVDANGNPLDPAIQNYSTTTNAGGFWSIANVPVGSRYRVTEAVPATGDSGYTWTQTAPALDQAGDRAYSGTAGVDAIMDLNFGNVSLNAPRGGSTAGY